MIYTWLIAVVIFLIVEAITVGIVSIWFAGGALLAMFSDVFGAPVWLQFTIFVVSSAILLMLTKPIVKKYAHTKKVATNTDALLGQTGIVTQNIDNDNAVGEIKVGGQYWSALSEDGTSIEQGEKVIIKDIKGVKLIVAK